MGDSGQCERRLDGPLTASQPGLPDILRLHARWRGGKPALIFEDTIVSWQALVARADRIARALHSSGLGKGDAVAVAMSNGVEMVEVLMGCALAGCPSAPLNLTVSDAAMKAMIEDSGARMLIATGAEANRLAGMGFSKHGDRLCVSTEYTTDHWTDYRDWVDSAETACSAVEIAPEDTFNIIYSSGTTGRPKGIVHTYQTRLDWTRDLALALRYHSGAQTLCTLGLYSNISWVMLLASWYCGATLHLTARFDADEVLNLIDTAGITHTAMVPVQFQRLIDHPDMAETNTASMQAMMSCGSPLSAELKRALFDRFTCGVIELYGLTEGVITTLDPEDAAGRMASVGKPMTGTDLKIIDDAGVEITDGSAGEIVSRSAIVMPGYLNRPDANAEAVWRDFEGRIWLRTGDVGRLDREGFLYIVDRKKDMIVSGGQNIFPADIENVALEHEAVQAIAVIGVPDRDWGETPVAIAELDEAAEPDAVRAWINDRVGKRQRIAALHVTGALPRNPNGKILKRQLREDYSTRT